MARGLLLSVDCPRLPSLLTFARCSGRHHHLNVEGHGRGAALGRLAV
jgi:hypothetical protein